MNNDNNLNPFNNTGLNNNNVSTNLDDKTSSSTSNELNTVNSTVSSSTDFVDNNKVINNQLDNNVVNEQNVTPVEGSDISSNSFNYKNVGSNSEYSNGDGEFKSIFKEPVIDFDDDKKSDTLFKIAVGLIVAILVLVFSYLGYSSFIMIGGKNVVKTTITKLYDGVIDTIDKTEKKVLIIDPSKDVVGLSGSLNLSSNYKDSNLDLTNLSKYSISYDSAFDLSSEKFSISALLNKDSETLLDIDAFLKDNVLTLGSSKLSLFSYTTSLPQTFNIEYKQNVGFEDIKILVKKAKVVTINGIDESKIEKTSVIRQGKSYAKITYVFNVGKISQDIINAYINDDEALEILSRLSGQDKDKVKEQLQSSLVDFEGYDDNIIDIYVDKLFGHLGALTISENSSNVSFELNVENDGYKFVYNTDKENQSLTGNYIKESKTLNINYEYDAFKYEVSIKEVSDTKSNVSINYIYKTSYSEQKYSLVFDVDNVIDNNKQTIIVDAKVNVSDEEENLEFAIKSETNIIKGAEVKENSNNFVKDINSISEEELNDLKLKFINVVSELMSDFTSYSSLYSDDYSNSLSM